MDNIPLKKFNYPPRKIINHSQILTYFTKKPRHIYINNHNKVVYIRPLGIELDFSFSYIFNASLRGRSPIDIQMYFRNLADFEITGLRKKFISNAGGISNEVSELFLGISHFDNKRARYNFECNFTWTEKGERNTSSNRGVVHPGSPVIFSIFQIYPDGIEDMELVKEIHESLEFEINFH